MDSKVFENFDTRFERIMHDYIDTDIAYNIAKGEAIVSPHAFMFGMLKVEIRNLREEYEVLKERLGVE